MVSHKIAKGLRIFFWMRWVFVAACGFSLVVANKGYSTAEVHRLLLLQNISPRTCKLQELWQAGSIVVAHGLSCSAACGIFMNQGLNPCLLHWQADSSTLDHQGSPRS